MTDKELEEQYGDEIDKASEAFTAPADSLEGLELQPYTPDRAWAAQAMGLRYGFVDDAGVAEFGRSGIYPGALRDCGIVLWLCSLTEARDIDKAARDPLGAATSAAKWSHEQKIDNVNSKEFWPAYRIFIRLMSEVADSTTSPKN